MTETTTESPAILKREALRLAGLPVDGDWPESVTPGELAAMQYPCDHTTAPEARKLPRRKQRDLAALAKAAIDAGELPTVPAVRQVSAMAKATEMRNSWIMGGPRSVTRLVRVSAGSREVQAIERGPCAAWLDAIGKPPGEYVRAWLGDESPEEANGSAAPWSNATETGAGELATTAEVRAALALATGDHFDQFARALGDAPRWIKSARRDPAGKSKSAGYLWNVAELAEAVTAHYDLKRKAVHAAIAGQWPLAAELFSL